MLEKGHDIKLGASFQMSEQDQDSGESIMKLPSRTLSMIIIDYMIDTPDLCFRNLEGGPS